MVEVEMASLALAMTGLSAGLRLCEGEVAQG
jgi:hypothetical protein